MGAFLAYIRVSTAKQDADSQRLEILEYGRKEKIHISDFIEVEMSSRKSFGERKIEELLGRAKKGDTIIVAEMSRLGRSLQEVISIVNTLREAHVGLHAIKEGLRLSDKADIGTKAQVALFGLLAEIERDLISERTKAGLARARAEGKKLGRPKGSTGKSKLDGREAQITELLDLGVTKSNIAKICKVSWPTLNNFIITRRLDAKRI